jgi:hypothetical protein
MTLMSFLDTYFLYLLLTLVLIAIAKIIDDRT